jgi:hypothetical protein
LVHREVLYFLSHEFLLGFDDIADFGVVNEGMYEAFHHRASLIVFDEASPSFNRHPAFLGETLLAEVSQCKIICIGH